MDYYSNQLLGGHFQPHDPRVVSNAILDLAGLNKITHLALQKLLFFCHGKFLVNHKRPLILGVFEAWQHGPVIRAIYDEFKGHGNRPISTFAKGKDLLTGAEKKLPPLRDQLALRSINEVVSCMATQDPVHLRNLSHAKDGPWDFVVKRHANHVEYGTRISDDIILERFSYLKLPVQVIAPHGVLDEDSPIE